MGDANNTKRKEKKEYVKEKLRQKRKESKKNKHRARLIVRNLPFEATEENLREHYAKFGEIDEIKVLKKEDGTLLGVGFVQFKLVQKAAKARHYTNGKPFLDRTIECNWSLPKNKYEKKQSLIAPVAIKEEPVDTSIVKTEKELDAEIQDDLKETLNDEEDLKNDTDEENELSDEEEEEKFKDEEFEENEVEQEKSHMQSNDATEGRTIFIKNVPFTATNEDVRTCFAQFGPLYYALVCMDSLTEHSKGTAFVKFRNKTDADECLATPGIALLGQTLDYHCALTKEELNKKVSENSDKGPRQRDSRNLYLVKEGVVLAGSKAAEGVSATDMAKRLQVELYKTQMLKNLNMIVARTRLIVHNIPPGWNDNKLRALFTKHGGPKAQVKEARVIRNMRMVDHEGSGKSKEFAFITFTTHEAALQALRAINNNPAIFSAAKRPIVAFSIENRAKLHAKEKRLHNSRIKNPNYKDYNPAEVKNQNRGGKKRPHEAAAEPDENPNAFSGVAATQGIKKMRSKFNLRTQAQIHHEQLKKEKKKKKFVKKTLKQKQQEFTKQPRQKINKTKTKLSDNFSKIVNDYKKKLNNAAAASSAGTIKTKWFE